MIIAHISDSHIALDSPDAARRLEDFERAIADINALDPLPDVILHTGDVVHNGRREEYAEAVRILSKALAPVYVIPGNKDDRDNLRAAFVPQGYLAPEAAMIDYAIENFPVRLIAVDTKHADSNRGDFCAARAKRLVDLMEADTTKPIAVFTHHPPFVVPVGPDPVNFEPPETMERLRQTLLGCPRVIAVFSGHVHRDTSGFVGDVPATVVPCLATTLRRGDYPPHVKSRPVYHVHRFDPRRHFSTEARIVATTETSPPLARDSTRALTG